MALQHEAAPPRCYDGLDREHKRFVIETMTGKTLEQWEENNRKLAALVAGQKAS